VVYNSSSGKHCRPKESCEKPIARGVMQGVRESLPGSDQHRQKLDTSKKMCSGRQ